MTVASLTDARPRARAARSADRLGASQPRLRLLSSGDGWALVRPDGTLVYSALGLTGRRRCLEFAHAEGVVTLTS